MDLLSFRRKAKQAFEECERFINECTPEELLEYEKSLNIDPKDYESEILYELESYSGAPCGAKMEK